MGKASFSSLDKVVQYAWVRFVKMNSLNSKDYEEKKQKFDNLIEVVVKSAGWTFEEYQTHCMNRLKDRRDSAQSFTKSESCRSS
jgi:hypothetical protein